MDWYHAEIRKCTYRGFSTGFYFGKPSEEAQVYESSTYINEYVYLGIVYEVTDSVPGASDTRKPEASQSSSAGRLYRIEQRNKFCKGDIIEIMKPDGRNIETEVLGIYASDGTEQDSAPHAKQELYIRLSEEAEINDILRCPAK